MKRFIRRKIYRVKGFFSKTKRLFKWRKTIWESEDWDYHFLLIIMNKKLEEMEKLHRYEGHSENSEQKANEINKVRQSINMIIDLDENDYEEERQALEEAKKVFSQDVAEKLFSWWD